MSRCPGVDRRRAFLETPRPAVHLVPRIARRRPGQQVEEHAHVLDDVWCRFRRGARRPGRDLGRGPLLRRQNGEGLEILGIKAPCWSSMSSWPTFAGALPDRGPEAVPARDRSAAARTRAELRAEGQRVELAAARSPRRPPGRLQDHADQSANKGSIRRRRMRTELARSASSQFSPRSRRCAVGRVKSSTGSPKHCFSTASRSMGLLILAGNGPYRAMHDPYGRAAQRSSRVPVGEPRQCARGGGGRRGRRWRLPVGERGVRDTSLLRPPRGVRHRHADPSSAVGPSPRAARAALPRLAPGGARSGRPPRARAVRAPRATRFVPRTPGRDGTCRRPATGAGSQARPGRGRSPPKSSRCWAASRAAVGMALRRSSSARSR